MKLFLTKSLFSALALTSTTAFACNPITQADVPITITSPGTYCLTENVATPTSINIESMNVTLDLNGNTLSATRITNGVVSTADNVVIKNGTIANFASSVVILGQNHSSYVHSNTIENINFLRSSSNNIFTNYAKNIKILNNNINMDVGIRSNVTLANAIKVDRSYDLLIKGNNISLKTPDSTKTAVAVSSLQSSNVIIEDNTFLGQYSHGSATLALLSSNDSARFLLKNNTSNGIRNFVYNTVYSVGFVATGNTIIASSSTGLPSYIMDGGNNLFY